MESHRARAAIQPHPHANGTAFFGICVAEVSPMAKGRRKTDTGGVSGPRAVDTPIPDAGTATPAGHPPADRDRIAQRAYELYLERGGHDGQDQDDWYAAERELSENGSSPTRDDER
jgi:Protein of unknown function (DUF2934)